MQPTQPPLSGEGVGGAWSWEDLVQLSQPHSQVLSPEEGGEGSLVTLLRVKSTCQFGLLCHSGGQISHVWFTVLYLGLNA